MDKTPGHDATIFANSAAAQTLRNRSQEIIGAR
jgi:hypothetical protein